VSELVGFDDVRPGDILLDHAGKVFTVANTDSMTIRYFDGIHRLDALAHLSLLSMRSMHRAEWPAGQVQLRVYRSGQQETQP
jgi:hypothetical protein